MTLLATFLVGGLILAIVNQNQQQLRKIAATDVLTGLDNRLIQNNEDFDSLMIRADKALYNAKEKGRNRTELACQQA